MKTHRFVSLSNLRAVAVASTLAALLGGCDEGYDDHAEPELRKGELTWLVDYAMEYELRTDGVERVIEPLGGPLCVADSMSETTRSTTTLPICDDNNFFLRVESFTWEFVHECIEGVWTETSRTCVMGDCYGVLLPGEKICP